MSTGNVERLEQSIKRMSTEDGREIAPDVDHFFSDGLYGRMICIKAGQCISGGKHKQDHLAFLLQGKALVRSKYGTTILVAPYVLNVKAGDKRIFVAETDIKFITVHATTETDVEVLAKTLVE